MKVEFMLSGVAQLRERALSRRNGVLYFAGSCTICNVESEGRRRELYGV